MTVASTIVRHRFEAAHRLPDRGGKGQDLHGHSWEVEVTIAGVEDEAIEAGARDLRDWIDRRLDHGAMLGAEDPLVPALIAETCKVFVFYGWDAQDVTHGLPWPTVGNVAELLRRVTETFLPVEYEVELVRVTETTGTAAEVVA